MYAQRYPCRAELVSGVESVARVRISMKTFTRYVYSDPLQLHKYGPHFYQFNVMIKINLHVEIPVYIIKKYMKKSHHAPAYTARFDMRQH